MIRLAVRAATADAERVLAAMVELAPEGFEQVDGEGFVEFALYGAAGELPALGEGEAEVGGVTVSVRGEEVAEDWADRWRSFHRPLLIGERLWVRPPWEPERPETLDLVIDPGQAFGTGTHPTTRGCLELMLELQPGRSFADLGCGSGVLAIAAAKLGFAPVVAVDSEQAAVEASLANAHVNGVTLHRVERLDLRRGRPPSAAVVAANLVRPLLLELAGRLDPLPEELILSGLLDHEAGEVAAAFAPLQERRRLSRGGWNALLLVRPA